MSQGGARDVRESVLGSTTHLVELDLLREGERLPTVEPLPPGDYHAFVCRQRRYQAGAMQREFRAGSTRAGRR